MEMRVKKLKTIMDMRLQIGVNKLLFMGMRESVCKIHTFRHQLLDKSCLPAYNYNSETIN